MNINNMTKDVTEAIKDYKKSDHLMMRKTFSMKDVLYRKNAPAKELWRSEVSFDVSFCLLAVAAVSAFVLVCLFAAKTWRGVCRTVRHYGTRRRKV